MNLLNKMFTAKRGMANPSQAIIGVLVAVVFVVSLIPTIVTQIAGAENLTTTQTTILNLVPLFIIIGLLLTVVKLTGVGK